MSSNHLSKVPEIAEALAWLRQMGWPTSVQDIALGADIWAQIQGEALSAEQATCELLTRLIKQLPKASTDTDDDVLYRAILVRLLWKVTGRTDPDDGASGDV